MQNNTHSQSKQLSPEQLKNLLHLDDSAEFIGYVIWAEEASGYLSSVSEQNGETHAIFDAGREHALVYSSYKEAEDDVNKIRKSTKIGFLFDLNDHLKVFTENHIHIENNYVLPEKTFS